MRGGLLCLVWFSIVGLAVGASRDDPEYEYVTVGSSLKLVPIGSTNYRLHSHDINWGSGSGQQSVTAFPGDGDTNSLWLIQGAFGHRGVRSGTPIRCGDVIRLKHVRTGNFLHSHLHQSPLSRQQEVSCYPHGQSDTGDNWRVGCDDSTHFWKRGTSVTFQHADTSAYLSTDAGSKFDQRNCRNCPIQGQLEVRAIPQRNRQAMWKSAEGFFFPVSEEYRTQVFGEDA